MIGGYKKLVSWMLSTLMIVSMITGIIISNINIGHAASLYVYVISTPYLVAAVSDSGDLYIHTQVGYSVPGTKVTDEEVAEAGIKTWTTNGMNGNANWYKVGKSGTTYAVVRTLYTPLVWLDITYKTAFSNQKFSYDKYQAPSSSCGAVVDGPIYAAVGAEVYEGCIPELKIDRGSSYKSDRYDFVLGQGYIKTKGASWLNQQDGWYEVSFSVADAINVVKDEVGVGKGVEVGITSTFRYKSESGGISWSGSDGDSDSDDDTDTDSDADTDTDSDSDDDYVPEYPSVPGVTISDYSLPTTYINYKDWIGSVTASVTAKDISTYLDYDWLDSLSLTLSGFGTSNSESTSSMGGTVTTSISGTITQDADWLSYVNPAQYNYTVNARAVTTLQSGSSDTQRLSLQGAVVLSNEKPDVNFSLRTNNLNGGSVPNGYYYTNTPATLNIKFSDYEDDIRNIAVYIGKKEDMDAGYAHLIYTNNYSGTESYSVSEHVITADNVTKSINGITATLEFLEPGTYSYIAYINDVGSSSSIRNYIGNTDSVEGTFLVRGDPAAPDAIISSPNYAFENENYTVKQNSTDPNGVDDIIQYTWSNAIDVTETEDPDEAAEEGFEVIMNITNTWPNNGTVNGKNGGTLRFPTGSAHHIFKIGLKVKDATNLTDDTSHLIKVISNVPVASLDALDDNVDINALKENRKVTISAVNSLAPSSYPIDWTSAVWEVKALSGGTDANIAEDTTQRNNNKQRVLQFSTPGIYEVTVTLSNSFSKANPDHEDIAASTTSIIITVVEDKPPISLVEVISGKPNFIDNPTTHTVSFRVTSSSDDGDIITAPGDYNWVLWEDTNNDGIYSDSERISNDKLTYNSTKTEVSTDTTFILGQHNKIKAEVTTSETFGQPYIEKLLPSDGSYKRSTTVSTVAKVNWIPKVDIVPPPSEDVDTPYQDVDIDGDTLVDGKFIRAYTDDNIDIGTSLLDEFPEKLKPTWELYKKDHDGNYNRLDSSNGRWINNSNVFPSLKLNGGTIRISSPGIYMLKVTVKDDKGDTAESYIMIRIYTLPIAVLESNPDFLINESAPWRTKENIRFDFRANPTIVDDEWGAAWHDMDWTKDNWDVIPVDGQSVDDIHFMDESYTTRYDDAIQGDAMFSGRQSPIGFEEPPDTLVDVVVIAGLYGDYEDGTTILDSSKRLDLFNEAASIATGLKNINSKYNVKIYNGVAVDDSSGTSTSTSLLSIIKQIRFRDNSEKIVFYVTENSTNNYELNAGTTFTETAVTELIDYLLDNEIHFITAVPDDMVSTALSLYDKLVKNEVCYGEYYNVAYNTAQELCHRVLSYIDVFINLEEFTDYRSCTFTEPGMYNIVYWGTNKGGKQTQPVTYAIEVIDDLEPIIYGEVEEKYYRDSEDRYNGQYRANITVGGSYGSLQDTLSIISPDGDYIDHTKVKVIYDSNNNKLFTDESITSIAELVESTGTQLTWMWYRLSKIAD